MIPILTVIIPTVGRRDLLQEQFKALAGCTWDHPWQVLVADNGSVDGTRELCQTWAERLPGLQWIDASGRRGRSFAVNLGARTVLSPFVVFCDDDDLVNPQFVSTVGDAFLDGARVVTFNLDIHAINPRWTIPNVGQNRWSEAPRFLGIPAVWGNFGIERQLFLTLGGFDEEMGYAEDLEFSIRLNRETRIIPVHLEEQLVRYRFRTSLAGRFRQSASYGRAKEQILQKYPELGSPVARDERWRTLGAGAIHAIQMVFGRLPNASARYELADYVGRQWGRFAAAKSGR